MQRDFLLTRMALGPILKDEYKIFALRQGEIFITKTASAENEKDEKCVYQKSFTLSKTETDECFTKIHEEQSYKINNQPISEKDAQMELNGLFEIVNNNPTTYKDLIASKKSIHPSTQSK